MNFGSEERWPLLRDLHEIHGIPLEFLAIVANKQVLTIENRAIKDGWLSGGQGRFDLNTINNLVGHLAIRSGQQSKKLAHGEELSETDEKHMRILSASVSLINKFLQTKLQLEQNEDQKRGNEVGEHGQAGEDILAIRADVEAFIVSIGEEEADPQLSGDVEQ
jgi:hypothetical protein